MTRPYDEYQNTPLWSALQKALSDLLASGEVSTATAPDYVVGFLCRELAARHVVTADALAPTPGR